MTSPMRYERDLAVLLDELYVAGIPDYRDDIVRQTARTRQRPAWTFPERWLPVDITTRAVPIARMPGRQLGVLALIGLLIAAALVAFVGSQQRELPAPFGPAANGSIVFSEGGDIYTADPVTGEATAIVSGPETDARPIWSRDGTRVAFERKVGNGRGLLLVAGEDGQGLIQVTPDPLPGLNGWSFSPDGASIVALTGLAEPTIMVVPSDGSGEPRFFDVGATADDGAPQYRADGSEILFIGRKPGAAYRDVYALDPASGNVRTIVDGAVTADIHGASWSPDGTHIAYGTFDQTTDVVSAETHVVAADGTRDVTIDTHPDSIASSGTTWSNDGTRLIIARIFPDEKNTRSVVVPIDRSGVGVDLGCLSGAPADDCTADWSWSPDDSVLLGTRSGSPQFLADPSTGEIRPAPWSATGFPAWQRVAP